ncbi:MAG: metallophosphoesterase [Thermodesulfobacteriota bacterium]
MMALFLLTFFLLYGGVHLLFFLKLRAAFAPGAAAQCLIAAMLLLGLIAPLAVRALERLGAESLVRLVAWAGYLWMAVVFLFFCAALILDIYRLLAHAAGLLLHADPRGALPSARTVFLLPLAAALVIAGYGSFEARRIGTERIEIRSPKIPKETGRIRVVQISDVHVGIMVRGERLAGMLRKVREAAPDLLVATGDLVDGQHNSIAEAAIQLSQIRPRFGKFAVTGNHEFYAGLDESIEFMKRAGFVTLRGQMTTVGGVLDLAGVDDPTVRLPGPSGGLSDREVLSPGSGRFTILLKHQPVVEKDAPGAFDLQLSGHTHRGQIFPFSLVTSRFFSYHSGNFRLANGALLHVSRGTGTWGPPVRFLSPPHITVIDLVPE